MSGQGFSLDTLRFFEDLLHRVQLSASAPDFDELAAQVSAAKRELAAALEEAAPDGS